MTDAKKLVKENERLDDLKRGGLMLIQDPSRFCFGMDAVLLSGFAKAYAGERVCDLGTGSGIIPILMTAKTEARAFIGIDIQEDCVDLARRNVEYNGLGERVSVFLGDIRDCAHVAPSASFDVVTSNPPYMSAGGGVTNGSEAMAVSRHELLCNFDDVAKTASRLLKFAGRFYLVHRPRRLADIFVSLRNYKLEPKTMRLAQPYSGSEPNLVLLEAAKGGRPMLKTLPPLVIYESPGTYTKEVYEIYYG